MLNQNNISDLRRPPSEPDLAWIEQGFAIGSKPYVYHRKAICQLGIRVVVTLHEPTKYEARSWQAHGVRLALFPTRDWVAIPLNNFDRVVEFVSSCLKSATPILLHCLDGTNRAPTFAAAILCHVRGMNVDTALAAVHRARTGASPTPEQEDSLRLWYSLRCKD